MLSSIFFYIISNSIAIYFAAYFVPGINLEVSLMNLLKIAILLGIVNKLIKPFIKIISLPFIILTLGFFTVIINIAMLILVASFFDFISINGFFAAFWGTLIISLVNYLISFFTK